MSKPIKEISLKKMRRMIFFLGLFKIPMIRFCRPRLLELNETTVRVKIKLRRRTKNHLNSIYFGALAVGADLAGGVHAFYFAERSGKRVSFAFKGMDAEFIKRGETDIIFESTEGALVEKAVLASSNTGERVNQPIKVIAKDQKGETVATFIMIVSVKVK